MSRVGPMGWARVIVVSLLVVPVAMFCAGRASVEPMPRCPEDAVLAWSGTTNSHTRCLSWDDLTTNEYP